MHCTCSVLGFRLTARANRPSPIAVCDTFKHHMPFDEGSLRAMALGLNVDTNETQYQNKFYFLKTQSTRLSSWDGNNSGKVGGEIKLPPKHPHTNVQSSAVSN